MTNTAWIEWFQVFAWLGLAVWVFAQSIRVRGDLRAVEKLHEDVLKHAKKEGDPYRTPVHLPVFKDPVYCADCRFKGVDEKDFCLAMPLEGSYLLIGQPETNENHDCSHFQEKKK